MNPIPYQIILTWVSWSWKTSILEELIKNPIFGKPIQYTTRKSRWEHELDSYVFLTKNQFHTKLENGDFIEFTEYNWELYAIGRYFNPNTSNIFIVEPVGRAAIKKYFKLNWIPFKSYYLETNKQVVQERMENRWDTVQTIEKRLEDFKYFSSDVGDKILDASLPISRNVDYITRAIWAL